MREPGENQARTRRQTSTPKWPIGGGEMGERIGTFAWADTTLGPLDTWPQSLRTAVDLMLVNGFPTAMALGQERITLYNDAYAQLIGTNHPAALGRSTLETVSDVRPLYELIQERVWCGETVRQEDQLYSFKRNGILEDAWFTITYSPLRDKTGTVVGVFTVLIETTKQHHAEAVMRESQEALHTSEEKYRTLFKTINAGFCLYELLYNEKGKLIDWRVIRSRVDWCKARVIFDPQQVSGSRSGRCSSSRSTRRSIWLAPPRPATTCSLVRGSSWRVAIRLNVRLRIVSWRCVIVQQ